ncbi:hypothetical protein BJX99DRAFT_260286 [Aspergillus californicus]
MPLMLRSIQDRHFQASGPTLDIPTELTSQHLIPKVTEFPNNCYLVYTPSTTEDYTVIGGAQLKWSLYNLPEILYRVRSQIDDTRLLIPVRKTRHQVFGKQVNDFTILPCRISSEVEGWRLEAWLRLDRRITAQDIIDRVHPNYRINFTPQEIFRRRRKFGYSFKVSCWDMGFESTVARLSRALEVKGIDPRNNSTRGLTPGLINPEKWVEGDRIHIPQDFDCRIAPTAIIGPQVILLSSGHWAYSTEEGTWLVDDKGRWEYVQDTAESRGILSPPSEPLEARTFAHMPQPQLYLETNPFVSQAQARPLAIAEQNTPVAQTQTITYSQSTRLRQPQATTPTRTSRRPHSKVVASHSAQNLAFRVSARQSHTVQPKTFEPYGLSYTPLVERCELADYSGPPVREFREMSEEFHETMTLEEYLKTSQISYDDYIYSRYGNYEGCSTASWRQVHHVRMTNGTNCDHEVHRIH